MDKEGEHKTFPSKFHLFIASKLINKTDNYKPIIKKQIVLSILGKFNIPKYLRHSFLKEIEELGYIKILNRIFVRVYFTNIEKALTKYNMKEIKFEDKSLSEIAKEFETTKQSIHKHLKINHNKLIF